MGIVQQPEPPPAEIIPVLDMIGFEWRGFFGAGMPMSEKRAERERAKIAADMTKRGEPFIWQGVRHPLVDSVDPAYDDNGQLRPGVMVDAHDAWPTGMVVVSDETGDVVERPPKGSIVECGEQWQSC